MVLQPAAAGAFATFFLPADAAAVGDAAAGGEALTYARVAQTSPVGTQVPGAH